MSWYSKIYVFVREYREKHWFLGFFLHLLLNCLLTVQILGAAYSFYAYNFVFLRYWVTSDVQRTIYAVIYNYFMFMWIWSLIQTCGTRVARVPEQYYVSDEVDKQIKEVTPFINGRYMPDLSTHDNAHLQYKILIEAAANRNLKFAEVDSWNRLRYCYMCKLIKPDRAHHCMSCGFCVVKYDHHCPWINKCVSHRNYKYFVLYLIYGMIIIVWSVLTMIEGLARYFMNQQWIDEALLFAQVLFCILLQCGFGYYPLGELLVYHLKLIQVNETTCEQAKPTNIKGDSNAGYDLGTYRNFRAVFGWGLWAIPLDTRVNDGRHFPITYSDDSFTDRFVVRRVAEVSTPMNSFTI
ncbi:hypothetical protein QR680_003519 [Steinernema hermaphroditum]|uniref:Palmitoyltransferase n=1 Tax=Steinernema hermaphroditum TaxID=289476 RepID=A0AA39HKP3_9BILA|nr:hypothetical protein QR680_003519 [Steinernema hermaphroditum]